MRSVEQQLSRIDLNLLVSLSVLIKEKNVSRAAEKLFISQPAMSRNLKRLREVFDDPLFHREAVGLRPTLKALELEVKLDQLLHSLNGFIEGDNFDASTCDRTFNIALPSLMSHPLMLPIIKKVAELAPNIVIAQHQATTMPDKKLESGELDFAIHIDKVIGDAFSSTFVGHTIPVIFSRKDHPLTKLKNVTIEDCLKYKFVDIILGNHANLPINNPAHKYIKEHNLTMKIAAKSGQLGLLTDLMKGSDHLLITNQYLMNLNEIKDNFSKVLTFDKNEYASETYLVDHDRTHTSQAHAWLKKVLVRSLTDSISQ